VTFLAMLELTKLNQLQIEQETLMGEIYVVRPADSPTAAGIAVPTSGGDESPVVADYTD
jgi:chromatin segregation and condensation protein Rec8/ScpA/Scc1 (kleisin family)